MILEPKRAVYSALLERWLMHVEILGDLVDVETIATGWGIREITRLRKRFGRGR